jgi:ATPase subunit of ABC transporter with duplicated ATPase domains
MASFSVQNVSKAYGPKKLFENVEVAFSAGRRYGLTGPNGAGKTTFMKILAGDEEQDSGEIIRPKKFGILRQDHFKFENTRVLDVVIMGNKGLWAALEEKHHLLEKADLTEADGHRLGDLEGVIAEEDGYSAESDAASLLEGLGIDASFHEGPLSALTGGYKLRVLLAQALFGKPEGLLLDEPTNHLDLDSIRWLESFLHEYEGVLITISHDRHFLNSICTHIADIDYETIIPYPGGYDDMVRQKSQVRSRVESETAEKQKKITQLNEFISRFSAGTRASQVQSRKNQLEKLKVEDIKRSNIARPFIKFEQKAPSGRQTLELKGVTKSFDGELVIPPFDALITRGEKICVIGKNGVGKSTLVRLIAGALGPDAGTITWGHNATIGYMPQDHHGIIKKGTTVYQYLRDLDSKLYNEEISGLLGRMLFSGEERMKPTDTLSGGETVRTLLCQLMMRKDNVLILDEPTNHLDLESIASLGEGLSKYEGTVIVVTHDQQLLSEVATRIWAPRKGKPVVDFTGGFDDFLARHADVAAGRR